MKKMLALLLAALMLAALPAALAQQAGVQYGDSFIPQGQDVNMDLDGDGVSEQVRWDEVQVNEWDSVARLSVTAQGRGTAEFTTDVLYRTEVYMLDLDADGYVEILISGDEMSDDYSTVALRWQNDRFVRMSFCGLAQEALDFGYGRVEGFVTQPSGDTAVLLGGWIDVFGTHWGTRSYEISLGTFVPSGDGLWHIDEANDPELREYRILTAARDLPAVLDGVGEGTVPAGTDLFITASDLQRYAWFVSADGKLSGVIEYAFDREAWERTVGGVSEWECFESLPYAG